MSFGDLLTMGLGCIVARQRHKGVTRGGLEREIANALDFAQATIQKWQNKASPTTPAHVEYLIIRCKREGRMEREWAEDLLNAYGWHPDPIGFLDKIYGESDAEFTKLVAMAEFNDNYVETVKVIVEDSKIVRGLVGDKMGKFEPAYRVGSSIQIKINAEKDENLLLLDKDPDGKIFCLSPSQFVPDPKLTSGQNTLPQAQSGCSAFYINSKPGREHLLAILTEETLPNIGLRPNGPEAAAITFKDRDLRPIVQWARDLPRNRRKIFEASFEVFAG